MRKTVIYTWIIVLLLGVCCYSQLPSSAQKTITLLPSNLPQQVAGANAARSAGNSGYRLLYYWIVTTTAAGNSMPAGPFTISDAPSALNASNTVTVSWMPAVGGATYALLRTSTPALPSGACSCAVATGLTTTSRIDNAESLSAYTVTTFNPESEKVELSNVGGRVAVNGTVLPPASVLSKLGEEAGNPTWNNSAWPSAASRNGECELHIWGSGASQALQATDDEPWSCLNTSGGDWTITGIVCIANAGTTTTVTPILTGGSATSILSSALTCGNNALAGASANGSPVVHSATAAGACGVTPCSIDANVTAADALTTNIRVVITYTY